MTDLTELASAVPSATLKAFDARQALAKRSPLVAFALHALAVALDRADCDQCEAARVALLGDEAKHALKAAGADLDLLDELYPNRNPPDPLKAFCLLLAQAGERTR